MGNLTWRERWRLRFPNGVGDRVFAWQAARDSSAITNPALFNRIQRLGFLRGLFAVGAVVAYPYGVESGSVWLWAGSILIMSVCVGSGAYAAARRAQCYRSGWLAGRRHMINSIPETVQRGISMNDWVVGHIEHDMSALGLTATVRPVRDVDAENNNRLDDL